MRVGRDEMNLAEFPFALLADRHPKGLDTVIFTDTVAGPGGEQVERIWTVAGSEEFGLPLASDELVYVALMEVTKEQGFQNRTIYITRYDLIKRLGWPDKGGSYKRLQRALDRLLGVTIKAERAFWDNKKKRYVDVGFHVIDDYAIYDEQPGRKARAGKRRLPYSYVSWNQVIFASFRSGYIKHLDTAFFFSLRSALSRRLYRYLDKKRYDGKPAFRIGLSKLAFEKLGMSRNYYPSHIKQELARAHEELMQHGFLRDVAYQPRRGRQDDLVVYRFTARKYMVEKKPAKATEYDELVEQLAAEGVTRSVAEELVAEYGEEARVQLKYLPFRAPRDAAAMLVESIKGRWEPPASYLQVRKEQQEKAQADQERQRLLKAARQRHLADSIQRQAADAVLASLPRRACRRMAEGAKQRLAAANPLVAQSPDSAAYEAILKERMRQAVMNEYPSRFNEQREALWARADGRDDDL